MTDMSERTKSQILKIAIVQPCFPHYRVSFFRRLADLLNHHARISVIYSESDENGVRTPNDLHDMVDSCVDLVLVKRRSLVGVHWQRLPSKTFRDADIVVVNWNLRYLSTVYLVLRCVVRTQRVIGWGHYDSRSGNRVAQYVRRRLMCLFDVFWCYTEQEAHRAALEFPNLKNVVVGLNNGVEVDPVKLTETQVEARRKTYAQACRFLFIGRVTPKSEFHLLLDALQLLAATKSNPTICIEVVAGVSDFILEQTLRMQCSSMVRYHGPVFDSEAIYKIASTCHYFVYPGSVGLSLLHAFSLGLPALIHGENSEHMPEISAAVYGKNILQFRKGDARSLADEMRRAASLPIADYLKMVDACIETVRADFNVARMAKRAADTLLEV